MIRKLLILTWVLSLNIVFAQNRVVIPPHDSTMRDVRTSKFPKLRELNYEKIPGVPLFQQPKKIDGTKFEIRVEEHGLCYPALFDWNRDGKLDLLVGEFVTGESGIKVYINKGTKKTPKYTGEYFYATDINGDKITNYQWCCIGIHPQIIDVDGDGYEDIISGQYNPGLISWWKGSEKGFKPRVYIDQLGYQDGKRFAGPGSGEPDWSVESNAYWNYSSARLADFNSDGLLDLFVAGTGGYRVALNVGTKSNPKFGRREFLFHVDGKILHSSPRDSSLLSVASGDDFIAANVCARGTSHTYLNPVDLDGDGVLDLIATDDMADSFRYGVYYFRGIITDDGLRFENAQPLFKLKDGGKPLPGCAPMVTVCDYNNDGINDILLGLSIPTINRFEGADEIYWRYLNEVGIEFPGKDAGESIKYSENGIEGIIERIEKEPQYKPYYLGKLNDYKYLTLRHRGFVFFIEGEKNLIKAKAEKKRSLPREFLYDVANPKPRNNKLIMNRVPVEYIVKAMNNNSVKKSYVLSVLFTTRNGYHLYTASEKNKNYAPLSIEFELPDGFSLDGNMSKPPTIQTGSNEIYDGLLLAFEQTIIYSDIVKPGKYEIKVKIKYQTCNSEMCLPIVEDERIEVLQVN